MKLRPRTWMLLFVGVLALWVGIGGVLSVFNENGDTSVPSSSSRSPPPTATPAVLPCEAAVQYITETQSHLDDLDVALQMVGFLSTEAGHNPGLILDEEWRDSVTMYMVAMGWSMAQFEDQKPPPIMSQSHNLLRMAFDDYRLFVENYARGITDLDDAAMLQAQVHVENGLAMQAQAVANRKIRCGE